MSLELRFCYLKEHEFIMQSQAIAADSPIGLIELVFALGFASRLSDAGYP